MVRPTLLLIILGSLSLSHTHPGESLEDVQTDAKIRADYLKKLKPHRRIKSCTTPNSLLSKQQSDERREQLFRTLRGEHSIEPGNPKSLHTEVAIEEVNGPLQSIKSFIADAKSGYYGSWRSDHKHDLSKLAFSRNDPMAGKLPRLDWGSYNLGNTLVLSPTVGAGPFFVSGERIRQNLGTGQLGIPLYLDIQVVDINTCEPIPNVAVDLWQANATGVYSGVDEVGNGLRDPRNIQNQDLRGIQISDGQGSVQFHTVIPGHYWPRAVHIHVLSTLNATITDSTIHGGNIAHVAQMYLDQKLNDAVFQTYPYNLNNQIRVRNKRDLLVMAGAMGGADPVLHYTQLGNDLKDGVFAWINFAIDPTADEKVPAAGDCSGETCVPQEVFGWFKKLMLRVVLFPNIYIWKAPVMHEVEGREKGGKVRDEI